MLTNRQKLILKAIIELYIKDGEPVGSKLITNLPYLGFSSATIRYDMAQLEEMGYLEKTHTSSGRIPSEQGFRYYLNHLLTRDASMTEFYPIVDEVFSKNRYSKEKALERAADVLSAITNCTAVGLNPSGRDNSIKKLELIPISNRAGVLLIVTACGSVRHETINVGKNIKIGDVQEAVKRISKLLIGKTPKIAQKILLTRYLDNHLRPLAGFEKSFLEVLIDSLSKVDNDNFYVTGMHNLFDDTFFEDFKTLKSSVINITEENIFDLISNDVGLKIRLGSEIGFMPISNCTIISIPYRASETERGSLAVIGPTRMNYRKVIPLLEYIAVNLSKLYNE